MQTSKHLRCNMRYSFTFSFMLLWVAAFCLWFNQHAIEVYWQQQYHRPSPLSGLQRYAWWRKSDAVRLAIAGDISRANPVTVASITATPITAALVTAKVVTAEPITAEPVTAKPVTAKPVTAKPVTAKAVTAEAVTAVSTAPKKPKKSPFSLQRVSLSQGDYVVFLGDSMMQSFAPRMQRWLKKNYRVNSINMGRHSTGLTRQDYFDWPAKAEASLSHYKNLKLVVVMLGANDPWGIQTNKRYPFYSKEWQRIYSQRMLRIVNAAHRQGAQVIWLGLPYMRKPKYNQKIVKLDALMRKTLAKKAIYVPVATLLSQGKNAYRHSLKVNGKWHRLRQKDGIHLSSYGNQTVFQAVKTYLDMRTPAEQTKSANNYQ